MRLNEICLSIAIAMERITTGCKPIKRGCRIGVAHSQEYISRFMEYRLGNAGLGGNIPMDIETLMIEEDTKLPVMMHQRIFRQGMRTMRDVQREKRIHPYIYIYIYMCVC